MHLIVNDRVIELDKEGFLKNLNDWNKDVAALIAEHDNIQLTEAHWEIISCLREFYQIFELSPSMRALVKYIDKTLGPEKGRSVYLLQLFPASPAKLASKIAGLPKPANCL
jgi:tRNA 2-thiouridine synthesizing protein E